MKYEPKFCLICGKLISFTFKKGIRNYGERKYCSQACAHKGIPRPKPKVKPLISCQVCSRIIPKERNRNWNMYYKKKFCSIKCSAIGQSRKVKLICSTCGKEITRSPSHIRGKIYCSQKCRQKKITVTCEICGKAFVIRPSERICKHIYCSMRCQGISKRKNNSQSQGRRSPEDLAWKQQILKIGEYKCAKCGNGKNLEAHHIKSIKDFPELRHVLSNGLCVCHNCHYYGIHKGAPNFIHGRYSK